MTGTKMVRCQHDETGRMGMLPADEPLPKGWSRIPDDAATPAPDALPPGWVRLTVGAGDAMYVPADGISAVRQEPSGDAIVHMRCDSTDEEGWITQDSPAEVLSRIAEAQRAQRRFDALPGMAATLAYGQRDAEVCGPSGAVADAIAQLDAIEARERGE